MAQAVAETEAEPEGVAEIVGAEGIVDAGEIGVAAAPSGAAVATPRVAAVGMVVTVEAGAVTVEIVEEAAHMANAAVVVEVAIEGIVEVAASEVVEAAADSPLAPSRSKASLIVSLGKTRPSRNLTPQ